MEISDFIQKYSKYPQPPKDYEEEAKWKENMFFEAWLKKYPNNQHDLIRTRLQYIRKYTLKYPDFDGETYFPSISATTYYDSREKNIEFVGFTEKDFFLIKEMTKAVNDLGLSSEATFELIVFLWKELKKWKDYGSIEWVSKKIKRIFKLINDKPNVTLKLDVKVDKKHVKFNNSDFIKSLFAVYLHADVQDYVENTRPKKREIDYILIKTLLDNLPIKCEKKGKYTQAERNLALSALWLTGEIIHGKFDSPIDSETFSNGSFDSLIRDYKDMPLPVIRPIY